MAAADAAPAPGPERKRDRMRRYARRYVRVPLAVRTGDLPKRAASALVMLAIAIGALVAGGQWLVLLVIAVALAALVEFVVLVFKATRNPASRAAAILAGCLYIGFGALILATMPRLVFVILIGTVIATDTGAYFAGRTIGGPRIAPRISPSKTWAGLGGGMVAAGLWLVLAVAVINAALPGTEGTGLALWQLTLAAGGGAALAISAQAGDFLESWLKRKAAVKDSSRLIPGHGGVLDRVDGIIPVALVVGLAGEAWVW